jgi:hypothetical protein
MLKPEEILVTADASPDAYTMGPRRWHAEISCATEETDQGAAKV